MLTALLQCTLALTPQYEKNYDNYDGSGAVYYIVYEPSYYWNYSIRVGYDMDKGPSIITGFRVFYRSYPGSSGLHDTRIRFKGDTQSVNWLIDDLPYTGSVTWYTAIYSGPTYLIDDDPEIEMIGLELQSNCFYVWMDEPGFNHSYFHSPFSGDWELEPDYEYMLEARYEQVDNLTLGSEKSGSIDSTDFVDAYFVNLTENYQYNFTLNVTSGTGNLNMRLVSNQELTNDLLNSTSGAANPEYMTFIPSSTDKYVILVEPETEGADIADYSISFTENQIPFANFTANNTKILVNDYVQFNFTGDPGDYPPTFTWDFGDGSPISNDQDPIHQYTSADNYTVMLNVTDAEGEENIEIKTDYIKVEVDTSPLANFTANETNILVNEFVKFNFTGDFGNTPSIFTWDFGDGSPKSNDQDPIHQYISPNNYTVTLNVTDAYGEESIEIKTDYIKVEGNTSPLANFTANNTKILVNDYIQFNFTGNPGDFPPTFTWNFGDGSPTSNDQDPIHQYSSAGNYTVTLNVTDSDEEENIESKTNFINVEIDTSPLANFTANVTNIITSEFVKFTFTGDFGNTPTNFTWDFGDGSPTSNIQDPVHQYTSINNFTVTLIVIDAFGEESTEIKVDYIKVEVNTIPGANFTASVTHLVVGQLVQFTYTSIITWTNMPLKFEWDFGDGSPISNESNPTHRYLIPGIYNVSLTVTDRNGDNNTVNKINYITVDPINDGGIISGFEFGTLFVISMLCIAALSYKFHKKK